MNRIPFWVPVLPLVLGLLGYWLYWRGEAAAFRAEVAAHVGGAAVESGGFPYRVEARIGAVAIRRETPELSLSVGADTAVVNRQPWRTGHVVVAAENPRLQIALAGLAGARLDVEAPAMLASIRRPEETLERLSMRFDRAKVWLPFVGGPFAATDFELHLRETPALAAAGTAPSFPVQAEARVAGTLERADGLRFGIEIPLFATARTRIASVAGWRDGGTVEVKGARLLTADGKPLAGIEATLAPLPDGRIAVSGTVSTECPATVAALLQGGVPAVEYRSRRDRALTLTGDSGTGFALGAPEGPSGGPVRSQEPPCPALHR